MGRPIVVSSAEPKWAHPDDVAGATAGAAAPGMSRAASSEAASSQALRARSSTRSARHLRRGLVLADALCAGLGAQVGEALRFGFVGPVDPDSTMASQVNLALGIVLPVLWVASLAVQRAYDLRFVGLGRDEMSATVRGFMLLTVLITFVSFAFKIPISRGFVLLALPLTLALTAANRVSARHVMTTLRKRGRATTPLLLVGPPESVLLFARHLRADPGCETVPVGACLVGEVDEASESLLRTHDLRNVGEVSAVRAAAERSGARAVAVVGALPGEDLQAILWQLERTEIPVLVAPGVSSVTPRRLGIRDVAGVSLIHVASPEVSGARHVVKGLFDRVAAALALIVLAPLLVAIAIAVKCTSEGPVLFRQTRVGRDSKPFRMLKFRSMCLDAEHLVLELTNSNESDGGVLFKLRHDPRVTGVGAVLRRYSLDELPQLVNVLLGSMSLVGPRPALPTEVVRYNDDMLRRLLVKPGLTGLWQVSGRSDLPWDEAVRLDLAYVDQWSLGMDARVIMQTMGAVMRARGAY